MGTRNNMYPPEEVVDAANAHGIDRYTHKERKQIFLLVSLLPAAAEYLGGSPISTSAKREALLLHFLPFCASTTPDNVEAIHPMAMKAAKGGYIRSQINPTYLL